LQAVAVEVMTVVAVEVLVVTELPQLIYLLLQITQ